MGYLPLVPTASGVSFGGMQFNGVTGHFEALILSQLGSTSPSSGVSVGVSATYGGTFSAIAATVYANFTETNIYGETLPSVEVGPINFTLQSNPTTAATVAVGSNSTGTLPAGGYLVNYTQVDAVTKGQSTTGSTQSAVFTVVLGNTPVVTVPPLPAWANFTDIYLTGAGGTSGTETLYASGVTASTYTLSTSLWANGTTSQANAAAFPTVNTTSVNKPLLTFPTLQTNNVGRNLYITASGGNTGTETLYARGITATTYIIASAFPTGTSTLNMIPMPTVNTTSITANTELLKVLRACEFGNLQSVYQKHSRQVTDYSKGDPANQSQALQVMTNIYATYALLAQAALEECILIEANPGHWKVEATGIGNAIQKRAFP